MLAFAFDLGNGFVKARNGKRKVIAPSLISKKDSIGFSSISSFSSEFDGSQGYNTYSSNLDDNVEYIWGTEIKNAVEPSELIATYTHNNRYNTKRFKLLASFVLAELASDYEDDELNEVIVGTGLPSQEINTSEALAFKKFLQQKHVVTRNGVQRVINVVDVRLIEQPLGTLLNEYMNEKGQVHKDLKASTITVIDFGAGTTIIDTFKNLKRLDDKSDTYYEGMNDIYKKIARGLEKKHNIKGLDITTIEEGFRNNTFIASLSERKKYTFEDDSDSVMIDFVDRRISDIDSTLTNRDTSDIFILTGGGVNIVGEPFKEAFNEDTLKVVDNAQESNLDGFYKLVKAIALATTKQVQ